MPIYEANDHLTVSTDGTAGPYVVVTPKQLSPVSKALREEGIRISIDHDAVLLDGAPALAVINLGQGSDVHVVQNILNRFEGGRGERQRGFAQCQNGLVVRGDRQAMSQVMRRVNMEEAGGWFRKPDVETRLRQTLRSELPGYCFAKQIATIHRAVVVLLGFRRASDVDEMYIFGIVPQDSGAPLTPAEHDTVIEDVRQTLLQPLVQDLPVRIVVRRVHVGPSIDEVLSSEAKESLDKFTATADRSALSASDRDYWMRFIKQVHADDATVDPQILSTFLEGEGFRAEQISGLMHEYESGRRLLSDDEGPR